MEASLPVDLFQLLRRAEDTFPKGLIKNNPNEVRGFMLDRLRNYLRERGEDTLQVEAVVSQINGLIYQTPARLKAVKEFVKLPEAKDLATANKRVLNIIRKNEEIGYKFSVPDKALMSEQAEIALSNAVEHLSPIAQKHFDAGEYEINLRLLAKIKPDVDRFFDKVMVMVDDPKIRNNRAALLQQLGILMNQVADISKLAVEK
jgi:glycyl-tRNA synthetase beta chain